MKVIKTQATQIFSPFNPGLFDMLGDSVFLHSPPFFSFQSPVQLFTPLPYLAKAGVREQTFSWLCVWISFLYISQS